MSRRHAAEKREIIPDAKYGDKVLTKFMNGLMLHGKKSRREKDRFMAPLKIHQGKRCQSGYPNFMKPLEQR